MRKIAYLDRMMSYYFLNDQNPKDGRQLRKEFRQVMHSEFKKELLKYGDVSRIERKKARIVMWLLKNQLFDVYWYVRKHTSLLNL